MATIFDVAAYVVDTTGTMTTMKMEKLVFYSQALALAETGKPLFDEDFQAWINGPVSPVLFAKHRHYFLLHKDEVDEVIPNEQAKLTDAERGFIDRICEERGSWTGNQLSLKTHSEVPWQAARVGLSPTDPGNQVITKDSMREYYRAYPIV